MLTSAAVTQLYNSYRYETTPDRLGHVLLECNASYCLRVAGREGYFGCSRLTQSTFNVQLLFNNKKYGAKPLEFP